MYLFPLVLLESRYLIKLRDQLQLLGIYKPLYHYILDVPATSIVCYAYFNLFRTISYGNPHSLVDVNMLAFKNFYFYSLFSAKQCGRLLGTI